MAERILLEIVTPERKVLETQVDSVEVPGLDGEMGILPGHTELISQLKPVGLLTYRIADEKGEMVVNDGFVEVGPDRVTVLTNKASKLEDIDLTRALAAKERAELQLQKAASDPDIDIVRATTELEHASMELQLAQRQRQ